MVHIIVFLIGSALLIVCTVLTMQTRQFIAKAHEVEGKVFSGGPGKSTINVIEFWIKHSDYTEPSYDFDVDSIIEQSEKEMEKLTGRRSRVTPPKFPPLKPAVMPASVILYTTHTRYTFVAHDLALGIDHEKVPVLYDPESLSKNITRAPRETYELDSSHAMVNSFTSLYAYSLLTGVPGGLLFAGSILVFLHSRFGGWRHFAVEKTARPDDRGWITCPGCRVRFDTGDQHRWNHERHLSCGQRIRLSKLPQ